MDLFDLAAATLFIFVFIYVARTVFNLPKLLERFETQLKEDMNLAKKNISKNASNQRR